MRGQTSREPDTTMESIDDTNDTSATVSNDTPVWYDNTVLEWDDGPPVRGVNVRAGRLVCPASRNPGRGGRLKLWETRGT